jgi:hypothetical protein
MFKLLKMLYLLVIKPFKALLRFINSRYYSKGDRVSTGPEMALNEIFMILHVIDILYHTIIDANWGIGRDVFK